MAKIVPNACTVKPPAVFRKGALVIELKTRNHLHIITIRSSLVSKRKIIVTRRIEPAGNLTE